MRETFNHAVPYLRGRECGAEGKAGLTPSPSRVRAICPTQDDQNVSVLRAVALLSVNNFNLPEKVSDSWLSAHVTAGEVREWLAGVTRLTKQPLVTVSDESTRPGGFSTALAAAIFGDSRADVLLNNVDVEYLLPFRDRSQIPEANRAT